MQLYSDLMTVIYKQFCYIAIVLLSRYETVEKKLKLAGLRGYGV
jgi:hypothetical protein